MNPLTNMKNVSKLSEQDLQTSGKSSWHNQYKDSAWIYIGGLPFDLSEGDIICMFSQFGEVVNLNLIRAKDTGKSKGFCFLCYEDQRSTILAVDNLNGIKILNRSIRVDHVAAYKVPKEHKDTDEDTKKLYAEGCAPQKVVPVMRKSPPRDFRETIADQIESDLKLPERLPIYIKQEKPEDEVKIKTEIKEKVDRKRSKRDSSDSSERSTERSEKRKKKKSKDKKKDKNKKIIFKSQKKAKV